MTTKQLEDIITILLTQNENLEALVQELEQDLLYAEESIEMYEEAEAEAMATEIYEWGSY